MTRNCVGCDNGIEQERLEALPNTEFCIQCARKIKTKPVRNQYASISSFEDAVSAEGEE
jgi:RNA polymerase-binding transcription factor DksA